MKQCTQCNQLYDEENEFCVSDGTLLVSASNKSDSRVLVSWDDHSSIGEIPTQYVSIPQHPATLQSTKSSSPNWLYAVIGGLVAVILMGGAYLLFLEPRVRDGERSSLENPANSAANAVNSEINKVGTNQANRPANSASYMPNAGANESILPDNSASMAANAPAPRRQPEVSANVDLVYRGRGGRLPLTLTLTRNGNRLTGAALTPGDRDNLEGTVSPDGTFRMRGFNLKENRVTGYWNGRITNNSISGTWTATPSGNKVPFGGSR